MSEREKKRKGRRKGTRGREKRVEGRSGDKVWGLAKEGKGGGAHKQSALGPVAVVTNGNLPMKQAAPNGRNFLY